MRRDTPHKCSRPYCNRRIPARAQLAEQMLWAVSAAAEADQSLVASLHARRWNYTPEEKTRLALMFVLGKARASIATLAAQVEGFCSLVCKELTQEDESVRWMKPFVLIALVVAHPKLCGDSLCACSQQESAHV